MSEADELTVVVLAAGGGTRMKSKTMKVLHHIGGRSMIGHVLIAVRSVEPHRVVAVVGHQREQVGAHVQELVPDAVLAVQEVLDGTGGAVRVAMRASGTTRGTVVVATGDTPLLEGESLRRFVADHRAAEQVVSILSGIVANPFGYGRILRNDEGDVEGIVEEKDASPQQREIAEISSGILAFDAEFLVGALSRLTNDNAKGEYYLTDTVKIAREDGLTVGAFPIDDVRQTEGANDRAQLAEMGKELNRRIVNRWMREGVTVMDPGDHLDRRRRQARRRRHDPAGRAAARRDGGRRGRRDRARHHAQGLRGGRRAPASSARTPSSPSSATGPTVGPFAYLRPGTVLGAEGKIGTFVETKNAQIGEGAKVPHLSYVGDAEIGERANIGAGTIFANYDGVAKHRTRVGRHARTGSNNTFVAPVEIGDGASTGGGTVVRRNVPPGALAVSGGPQRNLPGWAQTKRAGTPQAEAAEQSIAGPGGASAQEGEGD